MSTELLLVYFVYGLAFYGMGLAVLLETGRAASPADARSLSCLAAFGIIHGTHEWLEAYLSLAGAAGAVVPSWLAWVRIGFLAVSFGFLLAYAALSLRDVSPRYKQRSWHFGLLIIWGLIVVNAALHAYEGLAIPWIGLLDTLSRYILAVPAAFLAGLALRADALAAAAGGRKAVAASLRLAAFSFIIYALTQVFVHPLDLFPARIINQESFLAILGIPVQVIRAVMATLIAVGVLRALQAVEQERRAELVSADRARVSALEQRDTMRRDLLSHIVRSQEDERARIARELHDEIAQLLSAFSLELATLRSKLKRADTTQMVDHLQDLSRQMSQGLYHLVRDLRPSHLDNLGLVPALNFIFSQDFRPRGLEVLFNVSGNPIRLPGLVETGMFRVAQEALTNVVRHAQVGEVRVDLTYEGHRVLLRVSDFGCGFRPDEKFRAPRGWGLAGMRERVESLAGELRLTSTPGEGTTIEVVVPVDPKEQKDFQDGTDHPVVS